MKAIIVTKNQTLEFQDHAAEPKSEGEVVQVKYAGVGFADVMAAKGGYILAPKAPFSPGYEVMGHVERSGKKERVIGMLLSMNGYRDRIGFDSHYLSVVPENVSDETAAALPLNYLTALGMIERVARLKPGQSVLIHGAAGGVGVAVLELCRILGLKAFGSCSAPKHDLVKRLGATPILRSELEASPEAIVRRYGGFDAVFDPFGGESLNRSWKLVKNGGILVCFGFATTIAGGKGEVFKGVANLFAKKFNVRGKRTRIFGVPALIRSDEAWYADAMSRILKWTAEGRIDPPLHKVLPWTKALDAHREIEAGTVQGKILLDFSK